MKQTNMQPTAVIRSHWLALLLLPALVACGGSGSGNETGDEAESVLPDEATIVAEVDGTPITEIELDAQIQAMAARGDRPDRESALEELIDLRLLEREAEAEEMHLQPDTAAEIRRQRAMLLANQLVRSHVDALDIDDDDLRAAYEDYVADAASRREYNARHILVETREEAEALIDEIEGGADFSELAREHSIGPSGDRGGDLDWFRAGDVVDSFADAVAGLETEEYTPSPIETRFGWHVILLQDTREIEAESFDDKREELRNRMVDEHIEALLGQLRADGDVEIHLQDD